MATCEWCGGTGWGEARPKVGLARKWLRVPCPNPECVYRAGDSPTAASGAENDPRVEAAARAMHAAMWRPVEVHWDDLEPEPQDRWLSWMADALAAADAVDPLRDREKMVPVIAGALAGLGGDPDPDVYAQAAMAVFDALNGEQG